MTAPAIVWAPGGFAKVTWGANGPAGGTSTGNAGTTDDLVVGPAGDYLITYAVNADPNVLVAAYIFDVTVNGSAPGALLVPSQQSGLLTIPLLAFASSAILALPAGASLELFAFVSGILPGAPLRAGSFQAVRVG